MEPKLEDRCQQFLIGAHFVYIKSLLDTKGDYDREVIVRRICKPLELFNLVMDALQYTNGPIPKVEFSGDLDKREEYKEVADLILRVVKVYNQTKDFTSYPARQ